MQNDTIILSRHVLHTDVWRQAELWRLWSWCLLSAEKKAKDTTIEGMPVRLGPGELAPSCQTLCQGTGLSREVVMRFLAIGKRMGLWELRPTPWWLRIKIVNWHCYVQQAPSTLRAGDKKHGRARAGGI